MVCRVFNHKQGRAYLCILYDRQVAQEEVCTVLAIKSVVCWRDVDTVCRHKVMSRASCLLLCNYRCLHGSDYLAIAFDDDHLGGCEENCARRSI